MSQNINPWTGQKPCHRLETKPPAISKLLPLLGTQEESQGDVTRQSISSRTSSSTPSKPWSPANFVDKLEQVDFRARNAAVQALNEMTYLPQHHPDIYIIGFRDNVWFKLVPDYRALNPRVRMRDELRGEAREYRELVGVRYDRDHLGVEGTINKVYLQLGELYCTPGAFSKTEGALAKQSWRPAAYVVMAEVTDGGRAGGIFLVARDGEDGWGRRPEGAPALIKIANSMRLLGVQHLPLFQAITEEPLTFGVVYQTQSNGPMGIDFIGAPDDAINW